MRRRGSCPFKVPSALLSLRAEHRVEPARRNMTRTAILPDDLARIIADPQSYADWDSLHETLVQVRCDHPFARAEIDGYNPFWVAAKHDDIQTVARANEVFLSGMGGLADSATLTFAAEAGIGRQFRSIVAMNEPDHAKYRMLTHGWFQPKNLRRLEDGIRDLARRQIDRLADAGDECDFVADVASHFPLLVVMSILGVPEADEPMMLRLTQQYFGNADDDLNRDRAPPTPAQAAAMEHAMGYYITAAFAGHDTTSSSLAGGLWALAERPDQLARVKSDLNLVPGLVEESIRWTTPIHQFVRRARTEHEVHGQVVRKNDWVVLCFPSGDRDEDIFEDPFAFRLDRPSNRHISFGYGAHMCLGMHLARMEMRIFYEELLPRLKSVELAGMPRRTITNFVGGPKYAPIRYQMV